MSVPIVSQKKADIISLIIFVILMLVVLYFYAWEWALLAIGAALLVRQYLRGRYYDMGITTIIFGGLFSYYYFMVTADVLLPVLFVIGGLYLVFREYFVSKDRSSEDQIADATLEIHEVEVEELEDEQSKKS